MASGVRCVIAPLAAVMRTSCVEWQVILTPSALYIMPDMGEDLVGSHTHWYTINYYVTIVKGPIWLYNIGCSSGDEVLEDCSHLNWGSYYYGCNHYDDVGVICRPSKLTKMTWLNNLF